ncbi:MAG: 4-hydroxy-3-methylbut-2-enyl diphosphate reductase, partial [Pseudomonadota bacterium]
MKQFDIPTFYRSGFITGLKRLRNAQDRRKSDLSPTVLDFGEVRILLARHFGFCYGVENAIEISYRALEENPGKRLFLLSQMIHNPHVNEDLQGRGIQFLMDTAGNRLVDWSSLSSDDVVIVPAFGTTLEIEEELKGLGVSLQKYNTTCPFVEKVWKRSTKLGSQGYTVVIHGK